MLRNEVAESKRADEKHQEQAKFARAASGGRDVLAKRLDERRLTRARWARNAKAKSSGGGPATTANKKDLSDLYYKP